MNYFNLIINADDFGKSHEVNEAIEQALCSSCISSSTIMANSQILEEVLSITKKYNRASFGVHLNLTEGNSITSSTVLRKYNIIDNEGYFKESNRELIPTIICDELKIAIKEEWNAQVKVLKGYGFKLSHLDGHHHCNTWKGLEDVLIAVAKENNILKVRNDFCFPKAINIKHIALKKIAHLFPKEENSNGSYLKTKLFKYQQLDNCEHSFEQNVLNNGLMTTDAFMSYIQFVEFINRNKNQKFKNCCIELMCHPGHSYYQDENNLIMNDFIGLSANSRYKLISYNELN
ncbi:MAG: ChbG/HpnK family deacetylase [Paludibacteraceae bacterium]|nr:ChbG/HpnK family deacetylase [Paludibacteraceae bacterium]